jgi:adenosylmethionine-8-amino-7-oxononanoate aminotransferase
VTTTKIGSDESLSPGATPFDGASGGLIPCAEGPIPFVVSGEGVYLVDDEGTRYLDGSSGAAAANLGHGNRAMADALATQARRVAFAHRTHFRSQPTEQLAREVARLAPGSLNWSIFTSGGSEANEIAMRMALEFWRVQDASEKMGFLSRATSYHGSTLGALSLTGQPARRAGVGDLLHDFPRLHAHRPGPHFPSADESSTSSTHRPSRR